MNRQWLFEQVDFGRQELMRSLLFLEEDEALRIPVHESSSPPPWCVRDVISHIAARECTVLAAVQHMTDEGHPAFRDPVDDREFNLNAVARRQDLSLGDVIDELDGIRDQLRRQVRRLPNRELSALFPVGSTGREQSVADALLAMAEHDQVHAGHIWRWRVDRNLLRRAEFRDLVISAREALLSALGGLHEEDMATVEVCGHWTVMEVMSHILSWDEEALRTAEHWTGERPWQEGALYDDDWNAEEVARRAQLDSVALADGLTTYHRRWVQLFDRLGDEELAAMAVSPWGERMSLLSFYVEMAEHDMAHVPDLEAAHEGRVSEEVGRW